MAKGNDMENAKNFIRYMEDKINYITIMIQEIEQLICTLEMEALNSKENIIAQLEYGLAKDQINKRYDKISTAYQKLIALNKDFYKANEADFDQNVIQNQIKQLEKDTLVLRTFVKHTIARIKTSERE